MIRHTKQKKMEMKMNIEEIKTTIVELKEKYTNETNYDIIRYLRKQIYNLECTLVKLCINHTSCNMTDDGEFYFVNQDCNGNCKICGLSTMFRKVQNHSWREIN